MNKSTFHLNVLNSKDDSFGRLNLYVYEIEGPATYKDLTKVFAPLGLAFDFSKGFIYLTEDSQEVNDALEGAGYKVKIRYQAKFEDLYQSRDRKILYRILYNTFENLVREKGFELSRKHKRRKEKVALPAANIHKNAGLVSERKTGLTRYVVKEGFEHYFLILEDGTVTLRIDPRPVICIPNSQVEETKYIFSPECTRYNCDEFKDCKIHKLGPVRTPKEVSREPVHICSKESDFLTMYCYKTREVVAIPKGMLFVEASPHNLKTLGIYTNEFYTLNKKGDKKFDLTQQLIEAISEEGKLSLPISKDVTLEFEKEFKKIEVEPWK